MEQIGFYLGIDGGGTASRCMLKFDDGRQIVIHGGPLNICSISQAEAEQTLSHLFRKTQMLAGNLNLCKGVGIGVAGLTNPMAETFFRQQVNLWFPNVPFSLDTDAAAALYGAHLAQNGIVLIAGTGSVCFGIHGTKRAQVGGGGHIIDDEGSGYALGREILSAVLKAMDGRIPPTLLSDAVSKHCGITQRSQLIRFVYDPKTGKNTIASLAPLLFSACQAGDVAALQIADRAAAALADMIFVTSKLLDMPEGPIAFSGSILTKEVQIREKICKVLDTRSPNMIYYLPRADAVSGAVLMARWANELAHASSSPMQNP